MGKNSSVLIPIVLILLAIPLFSYFILSKEQANNTEAPQQVTEENKEKDTDREKNSDEMKQENEEEVVWGVDSASITTEDLYVCVAENFGEPQVWGRYLGEIEEVSNRLTESEIELLHSKESKILIIYNLISEATGYDHGKEHAEQAIELALDIGVPEGKAIFADIEPDFQVDADFIKGWFAGISKSQYHPGIYGVFSEESDLFAVYSEVATNDEELNKQIILWTAYPQAGITSKEKSPEYSPIGPDGSFLLGWQYGLDAEICNIDTNLFKGEILKYLW